MKPNFALNLSHEGISLLHRAKAGWLRIGEVALDDPDLNTRLQLLRRTASDLENGGLTTKLVIPNSQVLYTEIDTPGPDTASRIAQIRDGLVGLTPYDVRDLVFDWRAEGQRSKVAVVARETLREAESFAAEYRFNPVSFVAIPVNGAFDGEPYFGPTHHAASLLSDGDVIEPDAQKIKIQGSTNKAAANKAEAEAAAVKDDLPELAATEPRKRATPSKPAQADEPIEAPVAPRSKQTDRPYALLEPELAVPSATFASRRPVQNVATGAGEGNSDQRRPRLNLAQSAEQQSLPVAAGITAAMLDLDAPALPNGAARSQAPVFQSSFSREKPSAAPLYPSPDISDEGTETKVKDPTDRGVPKKDSAKAPDRTPMSFTDPHTAEMKDRGGKSANGRRTPRKKAQDAKVALVGTFDEPTQNGARIGYTPETSPTSPTSASEAEALTVFGARGRAQERGKPRYLGLALTLVLLAALAVLALWSTYFMNDITSGLFTERDEAPGLRAPAVIPQRPVQSEPQAEDVVVVPAIALPDEAVANTGAAPAEEAGLDALADGQNGIEAALEEALRAPVMIAEVPVDGSASVVEADSVEAVLAQTSGSNAEPEGLVAVAPEMADAGSAAVDDVPATDLNADAVPEQLALLTDPQGELPGQERPADLAMPEAGADTAALEPAPEITVAEPIISVPEPQSPPTRAEAEANYAATGIWQLDPEPLNDVPGGGDQLDDLYIASIDPAISSGDAVALPDPTSLATDARPPTLTPPAALGTIFDLDDRGLVRATSEGAVTPEGVQVFAGQPPVVPGPRPVDLEVPVDETRVLQEEKLRVLPPVLRPDGLSESNERARLGGFSRQELASIRPSVRPLSLSEPRTSVFEEPQAEIETAATDPVFVGVDASALAVAASRAPPLRPSNFAGVIEQALREASRNPPKPLRDEASDDEPEPILTASVAAPRMPSVPSRASVAKRATVKNAINLGKVNLIGVYGSPSKRRALVRLSSGKYVKVEVGDRVDGGRVSAIGDNNLRYIKGGRNITLKMPKG